MIVIEDKKEKNEKKEKNAVNVGVAFLSSAVKIILIVLLIIIGIGVLAWRVTVDNGSFKEDDDGNTGYAVSQKVSEKTSNQTITSNDNGYSIDIDLDTTVDEVIKQLEENDGVLDLYIEKSKQKEYLSAFIKAELITQYPDLRSADKVGTPTEENEFQGCIQIHRATSDEKTKILSYIDSATFDSYVTSGDSKALEHFTLDENGDIIVAGWRRVTTNVTSNDPDIENVKDKVEYKIKSITPINYKSAIEQYSMPFDFLWALTVMSDGDDFPLKLAQLALNSKIVITIQDNYTKSTAETIETYDLQKTSKQEAKFVVTYMGEERYSSHNKTQDTKDSYETKTKIISESCSVTYNITEVDTWIYKYKNTYLNEIPDDDGKTIPGEPQPVEDTPLEDLGEDFPMEGDFLQAAQKALYDYQLLLCGGAARYEIASSTGQIFGEISETSHRKYTKITNHEITTTSTINKTKYKLGTPTVDGIKEEKNSSEDNFVTLFVKSKSAKSNILSSPDWLFEMLENGPKTADMVDLVKYLLNKAIGNDKFDVKLKFSFKDLITLNYIKGSSTANYIKAWENAGLWEYETKQSSDIPTEYLTEDGLNYIVYEDGSGGHNNVSYGLATFIEDSSKDYVHPIYGRGYYNNVKYFEAAGIDVTTLYKGALVDKQGADIAFQGVLDEHITGVETYLSDNLPEYQFSQKQKDALIAVHYQYGNINGFKDLFESSLNVADGTIDAEKIKNFKGFNFTSMEDRRYANWLLFTEGTYLNRSGEEITLSDIVSVAKIIHDYMAQNEYYYCLGGKENEETKQEHISAGIPKCGLHCFENSKTPEAYGYRLTCCATFVSWVLEECEYIDDHVNGCGGLESEINEREDEWIYIDSYDQLQAGDIVFMDTNGINDGNVEHVQIYVGDGCWYNAGGNDPIHKLEPYYDDASYEFLFAYRKK